MIDFSKSQSICETYEIAKHSWYSICNSDGSAQTSLEGSSRYGYKGHHIGGAMRPPVPPSGVLTALLRRSVLTHLRLDPARNVTARVLAQMVFSVEPKI